MTNAKGCTTDLRTWYTFKAENFLPKLCCKKLLTLLKSASELKLLSCVKLPKESDPLEVVVVVVVVDVTVLVEPELGLIGWLPRISTEFLMMS